MTHRRFCLTLPLVLLLASTATSEEKPAKKTPKEGLQAFNDVIGSWRATGTPEGTREEKQKGFWVETLYWKWKFKGDDVWLKVSFENGKHFIDGEMRYLPDKDVYQFTATSINDERVVFEGPIKNRIVTLERTDDVKKENQRLVFSLIHENRFLYHYETKALDKPLYRKQYQVGCTKEGVAFAGPGDNRPECVVSGGLGTIPVSHKGETYHVCCGGCRDAFRDDPEKFIKEYLAKKAAKDKK